MITLICNNCGLYKTLIVLNNYFFVKWILQVNCTLIFDRLVLFSLPCESVSKQAQGEVSNAHFWGRMTVVFIEPRNLTSFARRQDGRKFHESHGCRCIFRSVLSDATGRGFLSFDDHKSTILRRSFRLMMAPLPCRDKSNRIHDLWSSLQSLFLFLFKKKKRERTSRNSISIRNMRRTFPLGCEIAFTNLSASRRDFGRKKFVNHL